jgi:hypothetical protein
MRVMTATPVSEYAVCNGLYMQGAPVEPRALARTVGLVACSVQRGGAWHAAQLMIAGGGIATECAAPLNGLVASVAVAVAAAAVAAVQLQHGPFHGTTLSRLRQQAEQINSLDTFQS